MTTLSQARDSSTYSRAAWRHFDWLMLIVIVLLITIGLLMIRSATLGAPPDTELADATLRQLQFALLGLGVYAIASAIDYRVWHSLHRVLYLLAGGLLIVALAGGGSEIGDVRRWLNVALFNIQPAELAKVLLIPAFAGHLAAQKQRERIGSLRSFISTLLLIALPTLAIFIQPNLSTAVVIVVIGMSMFYVAGLKIRHIITLIVIAAVALPLVWSQMYDYQRERIAQFIDPSSNRDTEYNLIQAEISIGSGGLLGQGYTQGSQNQGHYLKVRHTDFIFSVIGEELGFIGALIVLALITILLLRLLRVAQLAQDEYSRLLAVGVFAMIFFQMTVNVAMNLRLGPVAGLPLPLVSYGGSSLVTMLLALGLVQSALMRHKKIEF